MSATASPGPLARQRPEPELQTIGGPSALGGDARRFVHLATTLAITEFKLRFFGSALGYLWQLMRPLLLFGVLYLVFTEFVKLGSAVEFYPVVLLTNIVLFTFFLEGTDLLTTQIPAADPSFVRIPIDHEDSWQNGGYAVQWWLFALMALFAFGWQARKEATGDAPAPRRDRVDEADRARAAVRTPAIDRPRFGPSAQPSRETWRKR